MSMEIVTKSCEGQRGDKDPPPTRRLPLPTRTSSSYWRRVLGSIQPLSPSSSFLFIYIREIVNRWGPVNRKKRDRGQTATSTPAVNINQTGLHLYYKKIQASQRRRRSGCHASPPPNTAVLFSPQPQIET